MQLIRGTLNKKIQDALTCEDILSKQRKLFEEERFYRFSIQDNPKYENPLEVIFSPEHYFKDFLLGVKKNRAPLPVFT